MQSNFFFKQKTAYEMRISEWSSDVCSSDLSRLAPSLLHDGLGRERELVLRDHDYDYLDPDRRENLQLAVHDVSRPDPVRTADDVDDRVHAHLRDRRDDGGDARGTAGRFRAPQFAVPDRAFPKRDHRRGDRK